MDRRERSGSTDAAMLAFGEGLQAGIQTALPGIIQSFNAQKKTAVVQVAIKALTVNPDYTTQWESVPLLVDCPVQFPGGGGVTLTFPIKQGDEALVVFASRCIDAWWQSGGVQVQAELRMHDYSDGFCIPGVSSLPNVPANISTVYAELRTLDESVYMRLNPTSKQVDVVTPAVLNLTGGSVNITSTSGDINVTSAGKAKMSGATGASLAATAGGSQITGGTSIDGKPFLGHEHNLVTPGTGNSGGVV